MRCDALGRALALEGVAVLHRHQRNEVREECRAVGGEMTPFEQWVQDATEKLRAALVSRGTIPPPAKPDKAAIEAERLIARAMRQTRERV